METTVTTNRVYPGLLCSGIEFFNDHGEVKVLSGGKIKPFTDLPFAIIELLNEAIEEDKASKMALLDWHPNSKYQRLEQFVSCRFGGLDFSADILHNTLQEGEYHSCSKRGQCAAEGILCKLPVFNEERLSSLKIKLMILLASNYTNTVISEIMAIPEGSYHLLKKNLYAHLKVQTKQEAALIARDLNLV